MPFTPYPWQVEDAATLASKRFWILGNEMRTGKTGAAILGALKIGATRVGVACPAIMVREWQKQLGDFGVDPYAWKIASYDRLARADTAADILGHDLELVIADEVHYCKTPDAKRTIALYGDGARKFGMLWVPRVWGLSGTLAPNHAGEYYTHLRAAKQTTLTYWQFLTRYCHVMETQFGTRVTGNRKETLPELRAMLAAIMSRRTQKSVWKETPEPFWSVRSMTPTAADAKALAALEPDLDAQRNASTSKARHDLGMMKVPYALQHITDLLREGGVPKVLIGVWHHDVLDALRVGLSSFHPITIHGGTPDPQRWPLIERFQTSPNCHVAIVQMKAGGVGINLSSAAHVVLVEPDWGRDVNEQFVQRPQHIARTIPLPVDLLTLAGSLDEAILRSNNRKVKMDAEITEAPASGVMAEPSLDSLLGVTHDEIFLDDL